MTDWTQIRKPNCTTDGLDRRDCNNCTHYETKNVAALGHDDANNDEICDTCGEEATNLSADEEHVCKEVSGFQAFINSIINFFRRLFGQPELCACGETILVKKEQ